MRISETQLEAIQMLYEWKRADLAEAEAYIASLEAELRALKAEKKDNGV